jgi:hypothetical protein
MSPTLAEPHPSGARPREGEERRRRRRRSERWRDRKRMRVGGKRKRTTCTSDVLLDCTQTVVLACLYYKDPTLL